ncbi:MAG: PqqD family protein [Bacteroidales bacterium]
MNIKKGFELRDVCGEKVIIASGLENLDFTKLISVNETGADIWNLLLEGAMSEEDLIAKFLDLYEGDEEQMRREVSAFLKQLAEIGVLE